MTIGIKHDTDKPRYSLLPADALMEVVEVMELGAKKYGDNNWRAVSPEGRYWDAAQRHLWAWQRGEALDPETRKSHLAHAACCALILLELTNSNNDTEST